MNQAEQTGKPDITVIGVGNILLKDDGIGIHIINKLEEITDPSMVEIIDGGTIPDLFTLVGKDTRKLIIVDAVDTGEKPGSLYRFGLEDIEEGTGMPVSLHEIGLSQNLQIMKMLNPDLIQITVIGIQIADISSGTELSREVSERVPAAIKLVLDEIKSDNSSEVTQ